MIYAVTIELLNTIFLVSERPDDNDWDVQEDISLDLNPIYGTWTPDLGPLRQILCVSTSDSKYYKVFTNPKDIGPHGFRPTGRDFGGLFPKPAWERFAKGGPAALAILAIGDDEPVGTREDVLTAIK